MVWRQERLHLQECIFFVSLFTDWTRQLIRQVVLLLLSYNCFVFLFSVIYIYEKKVCSDCSCKGSWHSFLQKIGWISALWNNWTQSRNPFFCCLWLVFVFLFYTSRFSFIYFFYLCLSINAFAGDNFFKSVSYTIEALCAAPYSEEKNKLRAVEEQLLTKRAELSKFETEYREASSFEFSCCCAWSFVLFLLYIWIPL